MQLLWPFQLKLYTPEAHNEMVSVLADHGVDGNLDEIVQTFANVQSSVAAVILQQAKAMRGIDNAA